MSNNFQFQERAEELFKVSNDFLEINNLLNQIAMMQFLIDWNDDCLKCKCEWYEFGNYLAEKFKMYSFQVMNK